MTDPRIGMLNTLYALILGSGISHTFIGVRIGYYYMPFTKVPLGQSCILLRFPHLGPLLHQAARRYSIPFSVALE
jgi:hypothetical protein